MEKIYETLFAALLMTTASIAYAQDIGNKIYDSNQLLGKKWYSPAENSDDNSLVLIFEEDSVTAIMTKGNKKTVRHDAYYLEESASLMWYSNIVGSRTRGRYIHCAKNDLDWVVKICELTDNKFSFAYTDYSAPIQCTALPLNMSLTLHYPQKAMPFSLPTTIQTVVTPSVVATPITWTASNTRVAKVSNNGTVTVVGGGTCHITAQTSDGLAASCQIRANASTKYYTISEK